MPSSTGLFMAVLCSLAWTTTTPILPTPPQRLVSLSGASDETLFALLQKQGTLQSLVAVSSVAHQKQFSFLAQHFQRPFRPPQHKYGPVISLPQIPTTITTTGAHIESIISLQPDLVIASEYNHPKLLHALSKMGIPSLVLQGFRTLDDIVRHTEKLATITHTRPHATSLTAPLTQDIQALHPFPISILFFHPSGNILGHDTLPNDLIQHAGMRNVISQSGWLKLSATAIAYTQPDFVIAPCAVAQKPGTQDLLRRLPGWKQLQAVQQNRVLCIEERALYSASFEIIRAYRQLKQQYLDWKNTPSHSFITTTRYPIPKVQYH